MGSTYSHTNLYMDCSSFDAGDCGSTARLGPSFEVSMGNQKGIDGRYSTEVWSVEYSSSQNDKHNRCYFELETSYHHIIGLTSINFKLGDQSPENKTNFEVMFTRSGYDNFVGGIKTVIGPNSSVVGPICRSKNCPMETTIVSYGSSQRDGLFVLQKKKGSSVTIDRAYLVTLAHYYVTKDVGLYTEATICRSKNGNRPCVEVKGPFTHPSADLRRVIVVTRQTCGWLPSKGTKTNKGVSNNNGSLLKVDNKSKQQGEDKDNEGVGGGVVIKDPIFSSIAREQQYNGLINSSGYTSGCLNHSIIMMCFKNCNIN